MIYRRDVTGSLWEGERRIKGGKRGFPCLLPLCSNLVIPVRPRLWFVIIILAKLLTLDINWVSVHQQQRILLTRGWVQCSKMANWGEDAPEFRVSGQMGLGIQLNKYFYFIKSITNLPFTCLVVPDVPGDHIPHRGRVVHLLLCITWGCCARTWICGGGSHGPKSWECWVPVAVE